MNKTEYTVLHDATEDPGHDWIIIYKNNRKPKAFWEIYRAGYSLRDAMWIIAGLEAEQEASA